VSDDTDTALEEQRRRLREQLAAQRQVLAQDLVAGVSGSYPRSVTMRTLTQEPELVVRLLQRVVGRRATAALPTVLLVARALVRALPRRK